MEAVSPPGLTWVTEPIPDCLACNGAVEPEEANLAVAGADDSPDARGRLAVMGRCQECGRWYGLLDTLSEIAEHEDYDSANAMRAFYLDEEEQEAAVWLRPETGLVSWTDFRAQQTHVREMQEAPPPTPEEVRALDPTAGVWEVAVRPATWFGEDPDELKLAYLAIALSEDDLILGSSLHEGAPHDPDALAELILRAAAHPMPQDLAPARPQEVVLSADGPAADRAGALADRLDAAEIPVRAASTEHVEDTLDQAVAHVSDHTEDPYFAAHDEDDIHAYFQAGRAFYDAAPWRRIEADKYLAFRLDDGPWHFLSVMGQMEEEPGLSVFDDFLHLCRFLHNAPKSPAGPLGELFGDGFGDMIEEMGLGDLAGGGPEDQLRAAGAVEGVTLGPLAMLHPQDGARLLALTDEDDVGPVAGAEYPLVHRYAADALFETPRLPLSAYRALLDAVREAVAKRRADPVTSIKEAFTVGEHTVDLRYPSKGEEILPSDPGGVRLVVRAPDDLDDIEEDVGVAAGEEVLHVEAPGDMPIKKIARVLQRDTDQRWYPTAFGSGAAPFWDNRSRRGEPCPYAFQLAAMEDLWIDDAWDRYPMSAEALLSDECPEDVRLDVLEA